jgi:uncharacterized RDD family membrane protein YckC
LDSVDKLTIDTPEQVALEFPLAGIGSRFLAVFADSLLQVAAFVVLQLASAYLVPDRLRHLAADKWITAGIIIFAFCLYWGYYAFFETLWNGQTPGKRMAKIRVIKDSGRPITAFEAIARNLLRVIDQIPGFYGVAVIVAFLNKRNRRLGDFVAGTVVVHERKEDDAQTIWTMPVLSTPQTIDVSALTTEDLQVIEAFLARRLDLSLDVRQATATRLADLFAARLNLPAEARGSNEDFLEMLAMQIRSTTRFRQLQ